MSAADRWDAYIESAPQAEPAKPKPLRLPPGMTWRAGPDQVGHLLPRPRPGVTRTLCGAVPVLQALAWPMRERCAECVTALTAGGRS